MITREAAKAVVGSFSGLLFFPSANEARAELINATETAISDEPHAQRFKAEVLTFDRAPTPQQIRDLARQTSRHNTATQHCRRCEGTGFVQVFRSGRSASDFCSCRQRPEPGWRDDEWAPMDADDVRQNLDAGRRAANSRWADETAKRLEQRSANIPSDEAAP